MFEIHHLLAKGLVAFPMTSWASESLISARRSGLTRADLSSEDISPGEVPAAIPDLDLRAIASTLINKWHQNDKVSIKID